MLNIFNHFEKYDVLSKFYILCVFLSYAAPGALDYMSFVIFLELTPFLIAWVLQEGILVLH